MYWIKFSEPKSTDAHIAESTQWRNHNGNYTCMYLLVFNFGHINLQAVQYTYPVTLTVHLKYHSGANGCYLALLYWWHSIMLPPMHSACADFITLLANRK